MSASFVPSQSVGGKSCKKTSAIISQAARVVDPAVKMAASGSAVASAMPTLPTCKPPMPGHALRGKFDVPMASAGRCAVVGSADTLRIDPRGSEIDAHSLVWRFNNAPTRGWESAVGSRTDVRLVNHLPIEKWVKLATNRSALAHTADGNEYTEHLCAPNAVKLGCIVSRIHAATSFPKTVARYGRLFPSHRISPMTNSMHQWGVQCNRELKGSAPSSGLFAVLLALATCRPPISLYGFWPFCCQGKANGEPLNYKYHQGNRTRWVCCSRGREKMEVEYAFYKKLELRKLVRLHTLPGLTSDAL